MKGTIIGDIVGSRFEFNEHKSKHFKLFKKECQFTDDTICTIATMDYLLSSKEYDYTPYLIKWCREFPNAGFSPTFKKWFLGDTPPYNSFGNGSAMRVSPVGWYSRFEGEALMLAETTAEVSHTHIEGIKGAKAIAYAVYLAKKRKTKQEIAKEITSLFDYKLDTPLSYIRKYNRFDATCQVTVPQAIICFLESTDFEDAIRLAISIGGDSDTIAAMTGGIAEAFYGVPENIWDKAKTFLPKSFISIINEFYSKCQEDDSYTNKRFELG